MTVYATPQELAAWIDPDAEHPSVPAQAKLRLRVAADAVEEAVTGTVFSTEPVTGLARNPRIAEALKRAVLQHAADLVTNDIDPTKAGGGLPPAVASKSLAGMSVSYIPQAAAASTLQGLADGRISPRAWGILDRAGLVTSSVSTAPFGDLDLFVSDTPIDPLSGRLVRP